jgi:hypothetical protein
MREVWLSVEQYAELRDISPQAVRKALRKAWHSKANGRRFEHHEGPEIVHPLTLKAHGEQDASRTARNALRLIREVECCLVPLEAAERNAIMSPRTWGTLESLEATDGQPIMRPRALENMAYRPTNSIPSTWR